MKLISRIHRIYRCFCISSFLKHVSQFPYDGAPVMRWLRKNEISVKGLITGSNRNEGKSKLKCTRSFLYLRRITASSEIQGRSNDECPCLWPRVPFNYTWHLRAVSIIIIFASLPSRIITNLRSISFNIVTSVLVTFVFVTKMRGLRK